MWSDLIARELVHEAVASRVAAADHDRQGALLTRRKPEPPVPSVDLDCRRAAARAWAAAGARAGSHGGQPLARRSRRTVAGVARPRGQRVLPDQRGGVTRG